MTREQDAAAIRGVIADHERAFNAEDPVLLASHFRATSCRLGVDGVELHGPQEITEAARAWFDGPSAGQRARYRPGEIEFLGADVALCHVRATAVTQAGAELDVGHAMVALYVFARVDERWSVVARHDAVVPG